MKAKILILVLSVFSAISVTKAQTVKDYFIPSNENNKTIFYTYSPENGNKIGIKTSKWFIKKTNDSYEVHTEIELNGKTTSIQKVTNLIAANTVKITKTISTTVFVTNKQKTYNPPQIFIKMPSNGNKSTWNYTDMAGDTYKCIAEWTTVNISGQTKKAIKVQRQYFEDGSIIDWASQIEFYVEGIGLWKIQTYSGKDYKVLESQTFDSDTNR